jgi:hypothetical protein
MPIHVFDQRDAHDDELLEAFVADEVEDCWEFLEEGAFVGLGKFGGGAPCEGEHKVRG